MWIKYKVKIDGNLKEFKCHYQKVMSKEELNSRSYTFDYGNCEENFSSPESILKNLVERTDQKSGKITKIKEDIDKDFISDLHNFNPYSLPYQEKNIGRSFHLVIKLGKNLLLSNKYIFDMGYQNKNRISLFLNRESQLIFRVIDRYSERYETSISVDDFKLKERFNYLNVEFGLNSKYSFLKILVNGKELVKKKYNYMIQFDTTAIKGYMPFVLGGDLNNANNASFSISELIDCTRTSSTDEKNELLNYIFRKERNGALFFDGNSSMSSNKPKK